MRKATLTLAALLAHGAQAAPLPPVEVPGTTSIYQVFGLWGSSNDASTDAVRIDLSGPTTVRFESVTGGVNCCSDPNDMNTPDGMNFAPNYNGGATVVDGLHNISGAYGDTQLPLLAMFTSEQDPSTLAGPVAALPAWVAASPASLAPDLYQVFYVGDGRAGFNDAGGALLSFTAPAGATRLYLGFADAGAFWGLSSWYADNLGSLQVSVTLQPVPEPAGWALYLAGLGTLAALVRRRRG